MNTEKKFIAYVLTILVGFGIYTFKNLSQQRVLAKRIKRNNEFLKEFKIYREKYTGPELNSEVARIEFSALMAKYDMWNV